MKLFTITFGKRIFQNVCTAFAAVTSLKMQCPKQIPEKGCTQRQWKSISEIWQSVTKAYVE